MRESRLIVFVKAPTPGAVKTRLRPMLSTAQASELYRCLVRDTLDVARSLRGVEVAVAYAADARHSDLAWLDPAQPMRLQAGRSLGERLARAFRQAFADGARRVVVVGSDAPDLTTPWLRQAFRALARCDVVLGPTQDGGYQLIGLRRPMPSLFASMPWSTPRLLDRTLERLRRLRLDVRLLESIADLDTPADLHRYLTHANLRRRNTHTARYLRSFPKENL